MAFHLARSARTAAPSLTDRPGGFGIGGYDASKAGSPQLGVGRLSSRRPKPPGSSGASRWRALFASCSPDRELLRCGRRPCWKGGKLGEAFVSNPGHPIIYDDEFRKCDTFFMQYYEEPTGALRLLRRSGTNSAFVSSSERRASAREPVEPKSSSTWADTRSQTGLSTKADFRWSAIALL